MIHSSFIVSYKIYNYFLWGVKVKGKVLWSVQFSLIHNIIRPRYTLIWSQTNFHNYAKYSFASVKPKCQTLTSPALLLQVVFHEITGFVPPRSWADIAILVQTGRILETLFTLVGGVWNWSCCSKLPNTHLTINTGHLLQFLYS